MTKRCIVWNDNGNRYRKKNVIMDMQDGSDLGYADSHVGGQLSKGVLTINNLKRIETMYSFVEIRNLYDIEENSFGFSENEITKCEESLSLQLPIVLREYYLQLGNHDFNYKQDKLLTPSELCFVCEEYLLIYTENQGVSIWGIKKQDLKLDNPPVYICLENNIPSNNNIWEYENTLYDFLIAVAYLQSRFVFSYSANSIYISKKTEQFIRENWKSTDIKTKIWGTEFFQNDLNEVLAILNAENQTDLFVSTKTEERLREIDEILEIEWEYYCLDK